MAQDTITPREGKEAAVPPVFVPFSSSAVAQRQRVPPHRRINQLRDPTLFEEDGEAYLLYAMANGNRIAITRIHLDDHLVP